MPLQNERLVSDLRTTVTTALPAANANSNSASIDLGTTSPGRTPDIELRVQLPATPALVDTKSITLKVQDSADGVSFADVADLPTITVTGAGGAGGAAVDRRFKFPIGLRRHIALYRAVENGGGNSTGVSSTLSIVV